MMANGYDWNTNTWVGTVINPITGSIIEEEMTISHVHPLQACQLQRSCVMHNPTRHHMSSWKMLFRLRDLTMLRECRHGYHHPDPDNFEYMLQVENYRALEHTCDGCCSAKLARRNTSYHQARLIEEL